MQGNDIASTSELADSTPLDDHWFETTKDYFSTSLQFAGILDANPRPKTVQGLILIPLVPPAPKIALCLNSALTSSAQGPPGSDEIPEPPVPYGAKTVAVCCHWKQKGFCKYQQNCKFAHPAEKQGVGPSRRRSEKEEKQRPIVSSITSTAEAVIRAATATTQSEVAVCCHWKNKGFCRYKDDCKFEHPAYKQGVGIEWSPIPSARMSNH